MRFVASAALTSAGIGAIRSLRWSGTIRLEKPRSSILRVLAIHSAREGACQTLTPNRKGFMAQHSVRLDAPHSRPRRGDLRFNRPSGLDEAATYIRARCRIEIICRHPHADVRKGSDSAVRASPRYVRFPAGSGPALALGRHRLRANSGLRSVVKRHAQTLPISFVMNTREVPGGSHGMLPNSRQPWRS